MGSGATITASETEPTGGAGGGAEGGAVGAGFGARAAPRSGGRADFATEAPCCDALAWLADFHEPEDAAGGAANS